MRPSSDLDMPVALDRSSGVPLHLQLASALRAAALEGLLPAGARLPASRVLAARVRVARSTVLAAYEQLAGEGYLEGRHGSGTYLTPVLSTPAEALRDVPIAPAPSAPPPVLPVVDLLPGHPATRRLADPAWHRAWRAAARCPVPATAPPPQGLAALREQVAEHLGTARGLAADPAQVLVTAGTDDALSLLCWALGVRGRAVVVEDPGYPAARRVLARHGARLVPVRVDGSGLVVRELAALEEAPVAVLVTPSHQYPSGGRLPVDRRLELLDWARRTGAVVVEDDYDSEFRFDVAPLPALASLDRHGRVVHVGTFSKVLSPWLRAGHLLAPAPLVPALAAVRADLGSPVDGITQQALALYLAQGSLRRHVARSRRDYAHARAHLVRRVEATAGLLRLRGTEAGLHAVLELPSGADAAAVIAGAASRGVLVADLADYAVQAPAPAAVVLGYGSAGLADLDRAVAVLAEEVRRQLG